MNKNNIIIYSWFKKNYIKLINIYNYFSFKNKNFIITYSCNLNIDLLIFKWIKWIFCLNKKKYNLCNKCFNCILFKKKIYLNYYYINDDNFNINYIKNIYKNLLSNINFNIYKIVYFSNFLFNNIYINNYLLKILEQYNINFFFIFSCLDNIIIPNTILSRLFFIKIKFPKEKKIFNLLINKKCIKKFNKNVILSFIRLNNNSLIDTYKWIKNNFYIKKYLIKLILNLNKLNINKIVKILNNNKLEVNLYILITIFLDFIKYKYNIKKYLYNLDIYFFLKKKKNFFDINKIYFILNKLIFCLSNIKKILNINKKILLYDLVNFLLINLNF